MPSSIHSRVDILRKPQLDPAVGLCALVQEQYSVSRRSLHHLCVHIIALCPLVLILVVGVADVAGKERLVLGALARELVQGEGGGKGGQGDVESSLDREISFGSFPTLDTASAALAQKWNKTYAQRLVGRLLVVSAVATARKSARLALNLRSEFSR